MKKHFTKFVLHAGTYDFKYWVAIGNDLEKVKDFIRFKLDGFAWEYDLTQNRGLCCTRFNFTPVIWFPKKPETPTEWGTFSHEIFHLVKYILCDWAKIDLVSASDEAYAHLISKITRDILTKLK